MNEQVPVQMHEDIAPTRTPGPGVPATAAPALSPRMRAIVLAVDRVILTIARRWLLFVNVLSGLVAGLPLLAPWLLSQGATVPANAIYLLYSVICHQKASRSFFVFGQQMAYCQRNMAIYTGVFVLGLGFALVKGHLRPLRWRWMVLFWAPMALDGFTQLFGWRESTWQLRITTGILFALACVWVGFPYLEQAFSEMRVQLERQFARIAAREATIVG